LVLGGDASAAAGPAGRHASAETDWKRNTEVLTYSRAKGIFDGLAPTGAAICRDDDSTEAIYGHDILTKRILEGEIAAPGSAHAFLDAVRDAKAKAFASNEQSTMQVSGRLKATECFKRTGPGEGAPC
jgi:lipid-binding SYLF domain-containing protein